MTVRWLRLMGLLAGVLSLGGCSAEPAGPIATTLALDFVTPASDDGAVLFTISGGPVDSVAAPNHRLYINRIDANTVRVILVGNVGSGRVGRVYLSDERRIPLYSTSINQVAARGSYQQRDPAGYALALVR
jgi:hypothetical protein